jgi:hypothetical protein
MTPIDAKFWAKAASARQTLIKQYANDPDVKLIDIGLAPEQCEHADQIVLRAHMTERWFAAKSEERTVLQREIEGIPVCATRENSQRRE